MSSAAQSSPHLLHRTDTGNHYIVIMPRHLTFPRSATLGRLLLLVLIASALLWVPLLAREARSHETERPPSAST